MKPFFAFVLIVLLSACTTTTTTVPDGTKITVITSDPKVVKEISGVVSSAANTYIQTQTTKLPAQ